VCYDRIKDCEGHLYEILCNSENNKIETGINFVYISKEIEDIIYFLWNVIFFSYKLYKIYSFLLIGCFYENDVCNVKRGECGDYTYPAERTLCESKNNKISTGLAFFIFLYTYI
jgi:hypothetical protein